MLRRIFVLTLCAAAYAAVAATGAGAKDGIKVPGTLGPVPPLTQTTIPIMCNEQFEGRKVVVVCHNTDPNPYPPKDAKTLKIAEGSLKLIVTAYPDGAVVVVIYAKFPK